MDSIIEQYMGSKIKESRKLSGGYSFDTWLYVLENKEKIIFRTGEDYEIENGKRFIVADLFEREYLFYELVNTYHPARCPSIYQLDISKKLMDQSYQIMSYMEGVTFDKLMPNLKQEEKSNLLYNLGQVVAQINNIQVDKENKLQRQSSWNKTFFGMLEERLNPLIIDNVLSEDEKVCLLNNLETYQAHETNALLHLDIRLPNLILNHERIHVIDSENCEVGDPLYELAVVSVAGLLTESFMEGYMENTRYDLNMTSDLFKYYKLERHAGLVNLFKNISPNKTYLNVSLEAFNILKNQLLSHQL